MDAETYIAQHAAHLTDAEKRYIRAFGAPVISDGPSRNPYTPGVRIADAPDDEGHRARMDRLDREAGF